MKRLVLLLSLLVVAPALAQVRVRVRDHRRPVRVIRVESAPPAIRAEVRIEAPSRGHVWEPGYWSWSGDRYVWVAGRWVMPPQPAQVWVEPRWVNDGGGWVFQEGYWATTNDSVHNAPVLLPGRTEPAEVQAYPAEEWVVDNAPPPPQQEVVPPPPGRHYVWIPGYWGWQGGRHVWVAGYWDAGRQGSRFVPGRWERHGHKWRFRRGGWHHR